MVIHIVAFTNSSPHSRYIETRNIKKFAERVGIVGFEDKYEEVIFLDCIFPHNIIGVIINESNTEEEKLVINPYLLDMIANTDDFENLISILKSSGIDIDQSMFMEKLKKSSFYHKWISQIGHRRYLVGGED